MKKKYNVIILDGAKKDVSNSRRWYNNQQKDLGKRFTADLRNILSLISDNPFSYAVV